MENTSERDGEVSDTNRGKNNNGKKDSWPGGEEKIKLNNFPGYCVDGIQYYDLKNVGYLSNAELAKLVGHIKTLLQKNTEAHLLNVNEEIRKKIRATGLDHIIHCN